MKAAADYIGTMNERITIESCTESFDLNGSPTETWTALYTRIAAAVESPATGNKEDFLGDQQMSVTRMNFRIRYRKLVSAKMRVVYDGWGADEYFDVLNVVEVPGVPRRTYLNILTEKRV